MTTKEIALTICEKIQNEYPKRPIWQTMLEIEDLIDKHRMKTFIINWMTNYGLAVMVVNTFTKEDAENIAKEKSAKKGYEITEVNKTKEGILFFEGS